MIIYQRYCCVCMSIFVFHSSSITQNVYKKIKIYTTKYKLIVLSIQPLKELAFRTSPCKQFVSFLSLLENDERCAEWNTTIIILFCFCKSATGRVVCVNRAVVNIVVSHIDYHGLSPCTDCMLCTI